MINYKFNRWQVSGEPVGSTWTEEQLLFMRGGTNSVVNDIAVCRVLYMYHVRGLDYKELKRVLPWIPYQTMKAIIRGTYSPEAHKEFFRLVKQAPEKLDDMFRYNQIKDGKRVETV